MNIYPLLMAPYFRHGKDTPWGGHMLRDVFMKDAPDDITGESLEISVLEGHDSLVANGEHTGKPLKRMIELWGEALTGRDDGTLPLLLRLIDTEQALSVQVHPGDEYALAHEGRPGKNEAWLILYAEPGAKIVYGLDTDGEPLSKIMEEGRLESCLHWETVRPGDVYYIPSGTVHAIGEGILCYEIQQSSDVAYRLYDWGRVDENGNARDLHIEKALEVANTSRKLARNEGTTVLCKGGSRTYYISDGSFELCRLNLSGKMPLEKGRMLFLTPMDACTLRWGEESMELDPFVSVIVPAALEDVVLEGNTKVVMSSLSDRQKLIDELGYRAENVDGLLD